MKIVTEEIMGKTTVLSVADVPFEKHLKDPSKIDIGFSASRSILTKKASDRQKYAFRMECQKFVVALLQKLLKKSPLKKTLLKKLSWLQPCKIASCVQSRGKEQVLSDLDCTLHLLCDAKRVSEKKCDAVKMQYAKFIESVLADHLDAFGSFDYRSDDRVDLLLYSHLSQRKDYAELWEVVQQVLLLSHSQAAVERGFSVHKQTTAQNIKKHSLIARRLIIQAVRKAGGPTRVPLTTSLLSYAGNSRAKYEEYLEEEKKKEENKKAAQKRKAELEEVEQMRKKARQMEKDINSLRQSADSKAEEAERSQKLEILTESNALRKRAKEKEEELQILQKKIKQKNST